MEGVTLSQLLQVLVNGLAVGCIYGLIALGFVLVYKATEMVNFAQGDLMMLGAFVAVTLIGDFGLPWVLGLFMSVLALAVFGYLLDAFVLRRVLGEPQFAVVMLTIGLGFIFRAVAGLVWGYDPRSFPTPYTGKSLRVGEVVVSYENLTILLGTLVLCVVLFLFFRHTRLGIGMQATSQNQLAAYYVGIPVKRVFSLVWAISAGVAAVAGILLAPVSLVQPGMGFIGIKAFAAAVIGGFGSIPGALLGGWIIGVSEQFAGVYLPAGFQEMAAYGILILALILRPEGLFAQIQRKKV